MSVIETIIGKQKPDFDGYTKALDLLQKFMIESKSQSPIRNFSTSQEKMITLYSFGALTYFVEVMEIAEEEIKFVWQSYLMRQGINEKNAKEEAESILYIIQDPKMHWGVEIGYNSARYWHKDEDANATKALARLLKTTR